MCREREGTAACLWPCLILWKRVYGERERELLPCLCLAGTLCLYVCLLLCERGEGGGSFVPLPLSIEVERK